MKEVITGKTSGAVYTYPDIFESATFFPDSATVHTYPANSTANPENNKSAFQSGKKCIRNESDNVWTGPEWKKINHKMIRCNFLQSLKKFCVGGSEPS